MQKLPQLNECITGVRLGHGVARKGMRHGELPHLGCGHEQNGNVQKRQQMYSPQAENRWEANMRAGMTAAGQG